MLSDFSKADKHFDQNLAKSLPEISWQLHLILQPRKMLVSGHCGRPRDGARVDGRQPGVRRLRPPEHAHRHVRHMVGVPYGMK